MLQLELMQLEVCLMADRIRWNLNIRFGYLLMACKLVFVNDVKSNRWLVVDLRLIVPEVFHKEVKQLNMI